MIIVDPDEIVGSPERGEGQRKALVDSLIGLIFVLVGSHVFYKTVKERPQGTVTEFYVELGNLVFGKIDGNDVEESEPLLSDMVIAPIRCGIAAPSEPEPAAFLKDGTERTDQAANGLLAGLSRVSGHCNRGYTVRDDDQSSIVFITFANYFCRVDHHISKRIKNISESGCSRWLGGYNRKACARQGRFEI